MINKILGYFGLQRIPTSQQLYGDPHEERRELVIISENYHDKSKVGMICQIVGGDCDVRKIAESYGGGGHPKAAGFQIPVEERYEAVALLLGLRR